MPITSIHTDPLLPKLVEGTIPSITTIEQRDYIWRILDLCCADSRFAEKAYVAILLVLAGGVDQEVPPVPVPPVLTTLTPNTIEVGGADFVLVVTGTGFTAASTIHIKGTPAPTTLVSDTEVSTPIDMALVLAPTVAPITVVNDGLISNSIDFTVTEVAPIADATVEKKKGK